MPQFRIAVGYRTSHRRSEPSIIAASFSPDVVQAAIDEADPAFERIEVGAFHYMRKGRRRNSTHKTPRGDAPQAAEPTPPESDEASTAAEQPAAVELDDGPSLAPSRRRR